MSEELFDVVIYEMKSKRIDSIVGEKLFREKGFYNAEKRQLTALGRINDAYDAVIVPTGKYKKGDTL